MERLLAGAPVMAAPRGLTIDGDQLGRVRPSLVHPTHEAGREHLRIHAVHQSAQPIRAGDAVKIGQEAAQDTLLQESYGWRPGPDRDSRAALRLTRDARLALQAEPGPTPPHPGAEAQGHELARVRREPAPAWQLDGLVFG